jgi:hypothetical protein
VPHYIEWLQLRKGALPIDRVPHYYRYFVLQGDERNLLSSKVMHRPSGRRRTCRSHELLVLTLAIFPAGVLYVCRWLPGEALNQAHRAVGSRETRACSAAMSLQPPLPCLIWPSIHAQPAVAFLPRTKSIFYYAS